MTMRKKIRNLKAMEISSIVGRRCIQYNIYGPRHNLRFSIQRNPSLLKVRSGSFWYIKKIITAYTSQDLIQYMKDTFKWKLHVQDQIWWKIHGISLQSMRPSARQIIQKNIFDYWATNDRESRLTAHRNATCKCCQLHRETTEHVLLCENIQNRQVWDEMLEKLKDFFKISKTPRAVELCKIAGLTAWHCGQDPPQIDTIVPLVSKKLV